MKKHIENFARVMNDKECNIKSQLGIINYETLSVFECIQALQTILNWEKMNGVELNDK